CRSVPRCRSRCWPRRRPRGRRISWAWGRCSRSWRLISLRASFSEQLVELPLVRMIAEHLIELGAGLHVGDHALLRAGTADRLIHDDLGLGGGAERGQGVEHEAHPGAAELLGAKERGSSEL